VALRRATDGACQAYPHSRCSDVLLNLAGRILRQSSDRWSWRRFVKGKRKRAPEEQNPDARTPNRLTVTPALPVEVHCYSK